MPKQTPFYDYHLAHGARMVDFAGWDMPLLYRSIVDEHNHTRNSGSLFDVSHMGRIQLKGADTTRLLEQVMTRDVADMTPGQCRYSLVCNEAGGVMDDVIVSREPKGWLIVCNASNRRKIHDHLLAVRRSADLDLDIADNTEATAMIAIQGPKVMERLAGVLPGNVASIQRYHFVQTSVMMVKLGVYRTGYTGEDGVELILNARLAPMALKLLAGRDDNETRTLRPAGLGARDTLRLEAGMPLYGHELTEQTDPISAGLGWAVSKSKAFIGSDAIAKIRTDGPKIRLVGLELAGRRIARQGAQVQHNGRPIGKVTSGTFGPTVNKSIAMAFVESPDAEPGRTLQVMVGDEAADAVVVKPPFYKRPA